MSQPFDGTETPLERARRLRLEARGETTPAAAPPAPGTETPLERARRLRREAQGGTAAPLAPAEDTAPLDGPETPLEKARRLRREAQGAPAATTSGPVGVEAAAPSSPAPAPAVTSPEELAKLPTTIATQYETDVLGYFPGETSEFGGVEVVDVYKAVEDRTTTILTDKIATEQSRTGTDPDAERIRELEKEARDEARLAVDAVIQEARGRGMATAVMDIDPDGRIDQYMKDAEESVVSRYTNPLKMMFTGADVAYTKDTAETVNYNEGGVVGGLDWYSRIGLSTMITTAAEAGGFDPEAADKALADKGVVPITPTGQLAALLPHYAAMLKGAAEGYGTREHLESLARSEEMITEASNLRMGLIRRDSPLDEALSTVTPAFMGEDAAEASDYATAFLLGFFDIDAFVAVGPAFRAAKGSVKMMGEGADVVTFGKAGETAQDVAERMPWSDTWKETRAMELGSEVHKAVEAWDDAAAKVQAELDEAREALDAAREAGDAAAEAEAVARVAALQRGADARIQAATDVLRSSDAEGMPAINLAIEMEAKHILQTRGAVSNATVQAAKDLEKYAARRSDQVDDLSQVVNYVEEAANIAARQEAAATAAGTVATPEELARKSRLATQARGARTIVDTIRSMTPTEAAAVARIEDPQEKARLILQYRLGQATDETRKAAQAKLASVVNFSGVDVTGLEAPVVKPKAKPKPKPKPEPTPEPTPKPWDSSPTQPRRVRAATAAQAAFDTADRVYLDNPTAINLAQRREARIERDLTARMVMESRKVTYRAGLDEQIAKLLEKPQTEATKKKIVALRRKKAAAAPLRMQYLRKQIEEPFVNPAAGRSVPDAPTPARAADAASEVAESATDAPAAPVVRAWSDDPVELLSQQAAAASKEARRLGAKTRPTSGPSVTDKAKMSPQKIADGFMFAMYKNRLAVHLLHDLQANKAAMLSITARLGNAAEAVPRAELVDLDRQLTDLNKQIEMLMVSLYRVKGESPVATAARAGTDKALLIKELQDTYARFQDVMAKRLRAGESVNMELFDDVIKQAEANVASSRAEYDEWFKAAGKKRKERGDVLKGVLAQARIHERAIAESAKFSEKAGGQVGQVAYRQALENAANRLDATLAGTNDSLDMAGRAMLRTVHDGWHVYAKSYNTPLRAVKRVQAFVRDFTHPLRDKLQTDDEKIASIAADMMGYSRNGLYEAAQVARAGETAGERLDNSLRFVTDADATDIGGVKVSHNASGNAAKIESLWARGSRTLEALAQKAGKEDAVALEALARAFMFESGVARTRTPTPAMAARVLKKAKNIDEFIEGLRILPGSGGGIRRETVVQNGVERLETYAEALARLEKEVEAGNLSREALKRAIAQEGKAVNIVTQAIIHGDTVAGTAERINAEVVAMKLADMGVDFERAGELLGTLLTPKDSKNANFEDALAVAEALGMRWDQLQTMDAVSKKVRNVGFLAMEGGTLPLTVFSELEKDLGRLVKSTDLFKTEETNKLLAGFLWCYDAYANMYRTSVLTGLWGFNPGHYSAAFFGALGQAVTMEGYGPASKAGARALGLDKAVRLAKRSFEQYRPALFMGKEAADAAQATRQGMAAASGLPTSKVLPNATASLAEPHITAFYDRVTYPDAEEVIEGMTWGQLRKEARKRGVLASGINAIGVRDAILKGRTWIDETPILRRWKQWQTWKADLADAVDQRQRVALYMENVLHRKMDFDEAADSVKDAYYDWNYPTNGFEREFLSRILMFWTFQRKALEQGGRVIASAFDPTKQQITGFAPGASEMARLKDQAKVVKAASFYGQRYGDEDLTEEEKELRRVFPGWATGAGSRNFLFNLEEDQEFRQAYLEGTGRRITHQSYTMPSSVGDFVDVYLGMLPAVMGGFRRGGLSGAAGGAAMYTGDEIVAMGNMYTEDAFSKVWEGAMGKGAKAQPGRTYTNPADDALLRSLGYFGAHLGLSVNEDKDKRGFVRLSPVGNLVYQAMPWFSVELKRTYQPFFEASLQPTWSRAATTWTRQYGGLLRGYYFDAPGVIEWDSKTIGEDLAAALREDERTAPVGTTPAAELAEREQAKYDKYRGGGSKKKKKKKTTAW